MFPYLTIFGRDIPMYGLMMMLGAFLAVLFACLRAKKRKLDPMDVLLCAIFCFIVGLLGAKVLFILTDIPNMITHFKHAGFSFSWLFTRIAQAGIVFYGGLIGGFLGGWLYTRFFRLNFWKLADSMIPFLPLAHGFGRIGCFCAGCCYGRQMDPPWGIAYTNAIGAPNDIPFFPTQLLEAAFNILLLFPILQIYSRKERKPGQVVGLYLAFYGVFRFCNEYLRSDEIRGIFLGVSTSQWISLALVPIGVLLLSGAVSRHLEKLNGRTLLPASANGADIESFDEYVPELSDCAVCTGCGECERIANERRAEMKKTEENAADPQAPSEDAE